MAVLHVNFTMSEALPYDETSEVFTDTSTGLSEPGPGQAIVMRWALTRRDGVVQTVDKAAGQTVTVDDWVGFEKCSMTMTVILTDSNEGQPPETVLGAKTVKFTVRQPTHRWADEQAYIALATVGWAPSENIGRTWKETWLILFVRATPYDTPPDYTEEVEDVLEAVSRMTFP